ncbi:MAG TPA: hypothetical protein VFP50_17605, partial [Anaeromyxobacteraceae bacterium]|nr:hypothetical protein [Anaeromyxobacteraceae bacterium]
MSRARPPRAVAALVAAIAAAACSKADPGPRARPPPAVTGARVEVRDVPGEVRSPVDLRPA